MVNEWLHRNHIRVVERLPKMDPVVLVSLRTIQVARLAALASVFCSMIRLGAFLLLLDGLLVHRRVTPGTRCTPERREVL